MPTFRPVGDHEVTRHQEVREHAFHDDPVPSAADGPVDVDAPTGDRWGLFDGDEMVSTCQLHELHVTLARERRAIGGLAGFATPPEHRGRGHGRELQRQMLVEFRERGYPYAVLWPESVPYYRETGWGLVNCRTKYAFPPDAVGSGGEDCGGRFEQVHPDDFERLVPVYDAFVEGYELALDRAADWWRERVLDEAWIYCWIPDGRDEPAGYVVYQFETSAGDTLAVRELASRSEAARRALLDFVARHLPQVETVEWRAPEETRLLHDAADPKAVNAVVEPGPMGRIVDVADAVETLPAARNPAADVTIAVRDSLVSANDGAFRIEPGASGPSCERVGSGADGAADVTVDVGPLSKLLAGTRSVETAVERGTLDAPTPAENALAPLFPGRDVYFGDFF